MSVEYMNVITAQQVNRYKRQIDMIGGPADNVSHRQAMKRASDKILEAADKASRGIRDLDGEGETVRLVQVRAPCALTTRTLAGSSEVTEQITVSFPQAKLVSDLRGALQDFREAQMQCAKWEKTYVPKPDPMPGEQAI